MKSSNHILIQGWMINELSLKGNELILFALIYGFSQSEQGKFTGSLKYLCGSISATKNTVINSLNSLQKSNLIIKESYSINNINFCKYYHNDMVVQKLIQGGANSDIDGGANFGINNTIINNTKDNKEIAFSYLNSLSEKEVKELIKKLSSKIKKEVKPQILFSESIWNDYETLKNKLSKDENFKKEYAGVDLKSYIEDCLAWSVSKNNLSTDDGWYLTLRKWMRDAKKQGKLTMLKNFSEKKETGGFKNY